MRGALPIRPRPVELTFASAARYIRDMRREHFMLDRRHFLGGACAGLCLPQQASANIRVPEGGRLAFAVLREGRDIGEHALTFERAGEGWTIEVAIDLAIKLGPVPMFRYEHRATERWSSAGFQSLEARTNDDGKRLTVRAKRLASAVSVESSAQGVYEAPSAALPSTHWNRRMLDVPFFNTQTGELMSSVVTAKGNGAVETASGRKINVRRFEIAGNLTLETWYDDQQTWAGLQFKGRDGSQIVYRRRD